MALDPQWIIAICAAVGLLITWTTTIAGAVIWVVKRLDGIKVEILSDIKAKHEENRVRVDAMQAMIIRHETILEGPEWNGSSKPMRRGQ